MAVVGILCYLMAWGLSLLLEQAGEAGFATVLQVAVIICVALEALGLLIAAFGWAFGDR